MLNDNAEALLDYLIVHQYTRKYRIKLLIHSSVWHDEYVKVENVDICTNLFCTLWALFRSKYIFHTQGMSVCSMKPAGKQIIFNLWHGCSLKAVGKMAGKKVYPYTDSYFLSSSPFFANVHKKCFGHSNKQIFIGGNPRNDLLFNKRMHNSIVWNRQQKIVLFMPTYRKSSALGRNDAIHAFPVLTGENIEELDDFLVKKNILLVIKPHPYQDKIDFLLEFHQNIKVVYNEDLKKIGKKLYGLLGNADALITDFSSVYFDYLLLNRPIGFMVDDVESYAQYRGYTVDNPLDIMPGMKIKDLNDLKIFLSHLVIGKDEFREERYQVNNLANTYKTGDSCQRILDFVGIKNE